MAKKPTPVHLVRKQRERRYARRLAAGLCVACGTQPLDGKRYCKKCKARRRVWQNNDQSRQTASDRTKQWYKQLREQVIDHYTRGTRTCMCPGCTTSGLEFLVLDHKNNDGKQHRKTITPGVKLFRWCITNDFPAEIQVLCWNCNTAKQFYGDGVCPCHGTQHNEASLAARRSLNQLHRHSPSFSPTSK